MNKIIDMAVIAFAYTLLKIAFIIAALIIGLGLWGIYDGLRDLFLQIFSK